MRQRFTFLICSTFLAAVAITNLGMGQTPRVGNTTLRPIDTTTLELYRQYIAPVGKIETDLVGAAIELVAARSVGMSEFRNLLRTDFAASRQEGSQGYDSRKLLWLITAVLNREGTVRWQHEEMKRTGLPGQSALPSPDHLDRESPLLTDVINFGRKCGRSEIGDFTFAVRQAHHPLGKQFLLDVLHNPTENATQIQGTDKTNGKKGKKGKWPDNLGGSWEEARFLAVVGLAELGVEDGVQWLIAHSKPNDFGIDGNIDRHRHARNTTSSLRANCNAALHDLSGLPAKGDGRQIEWDDWWRKNAETFVLRPVALQP